MNEVKEMSTETLIAAFVGALVTIYTTVLAPVLLSLRNQVAALEKEVEQCHKSREKEKARRMRLEHEVRLLMEKLGMSPPDWPDDERKDQDDD